MNCLSVCSNCRSMESLMETRDSSFPTSKTFICFPSLLLVPTKPRHKHTAFQFVKCFASPGVVPLKPENIHTPPQLVLCQNQSKADNVQALCLDGTIALTSITSDIASAVAMYNWERETIWDSVYTLFRIWRSWNRGKAKSRTQSGLAWTNIPDSRINNLQGFYLPDLKAEACQSISNSIAIRNDFILLYAY